MPDIPAIFQSISESTRQPASLVHLQSERKNAFAELAAQALAQISPVAIIPGKTAQLLNSINTFFTPNLSVKEKTIHSLQVLLSTVQLSLSLYHILNGETECKDLTTLTCRLMMASHLLYNGVLLTGWVPGERDEMYRNSLKKE